MITSLGDKAAQVQAAFVAAYGRNPDAQESAYALNFLSRRKDRPSEAVRDLLWALLSSAEFLTMP